MSCFRRGADPSAFFVELVGGGHAWPMPVRVSGSVSEWWRRHGTLLRAMAGPRVSSRRCSGCIGNRPLTQREIGDGMRVTKNLGMLLLAIWLILTGLLQVVSIAIPAIGTIMAVLAIAAGVLILIGREPPDSDV